ncbi:hypothetical protein D3C77_632100 [compost metagenome]
MQVKQGEQGKADHGGDQQRCVIIARILWAKADGQGIFAVSAVTFDIAQIIDVQHRRREQATGGGWQHHDAIESVSL